MQNSNPWMALAAYKEPTSENNNEHKFCGRNEASYDVSHLIEENLCVTIYGRTGIGKTSLLNAGVFPSLRIRKFYPIVLRFSEMLDIEGNSDISFIEHIISKVNNELDYIKGESDSSANIYGENFLWSFFSSHEFKTKEGKSVIPVLVLDQFEENFKSYSIETASLLKQLDVLLDTNKIIPFGSIVDNYRIVISIREDDLYRLEDCIDSFSLSRIRNNRYRLQQLTDTDAEEIIAVPGEGLLPHNNISKEKVIRNIISAVKKESNGEISTLILSLVCSMLYEKAIKSDLKMITEEMTENIGADILHNFYISVISQKKFCTTAERNYLENKLVDSTGRRNSINVSEMDNNFKNWRLLAKDDSPNRILYESKNSQRVELVHDLLAKTIYDVRQARESNKRKNTWKVLAFLIFLFTTCYSAFALISGANVNLGEKQIIRESKQGIGNKNLTNVILYGEQGEANILNCQNVKQIEVEGDVEILKIQGCPSLSTLKFKGNHLKELSLTTCPNLKRISFPCIDSINADISNMDIEELRFPSNSIFKWSDGVLWNIRDKKVVYARKSVIGSKVDFPYEVRGFDNVYNQDGLISNSTIWENGIKFKYQKSIIVGSLKNLDDVLDLTLFQKLEQIESYSFYENTPIRKLILKDGIGIQDYAFMYLNIDTLVLAKDVHYNNVNKAFWGCNIKYIEKNESPVFEITYSSDDIIRVRSGISYSKGGVVHNKGNVSSLWLPNQINRWVFLNSPKTINEVHTPVSNPTLEYCSIFDLPDSVKNKITLYVPKGSLTAYMNIQSTQSFKDIKEDGYMQRFEDLLWFSASSLDNIKYYVLVIGLFVFFYFFIYLLYENMNSGTIRSTIPNTIVKAVSMIIWCLSCFLSLYSLFCYLGLESYGLYVVSLFFSYIAYRFFFSDFVREKQGVSILEAVQFLFIK